MGNPLVDVIAALAALAALVAIAGFLRGGGPYDEIGAGALSFEHGDDAEAAEIASRMAQAEEMRQMLQARSERLERGGKPPLDVEAELARLQRTQAGEDPQIGV